MPWFALAAVAIGTAVSAYGAIEQGNNQKKMARAQQQQQQLQAARERTQQVREARIKMAQIQSTAESQGAGGSSGAIGGAESVVSQANTNLTYINNQEELGNKISDAQQGIINAQGIQAVGSGISKIGGTVFDNKDEIASIFKPKQPPASSGHDFGAF